MMRNDYSHLISQHSDVPIRAHFMMDQIAGHVAQYRNLRQVVDGDPSIDASWHEIHFYREGHLLERVAESLRIVPPYVMGMSRGALEFNRGSKDITSDVIYTNSSIAALFTRRLTATPTLLHVDSTPLQIDRMTAYSSPAVAQRLINLKHRMSTRLFTSVAAIHAWSDWARRSFIEEYGVHPDRVVISPPGVDLNQWLPRSTERATDEPVRVLFVGGDFERKGGRLLLDWFARQPAGTVQLDLVTRAEVEPRPGIRLHRDLVPNSPELCRLFSEADIYAMPSLAECFGIATVEAMAAGLPVVVSDSGGATDIVAGGVNGFIVAAGQPSPLAAALDRLVGDRNLRESMAAASLERARRLFDIDITSRRIIDGLRSIQRPIAPHDDVLDKRASHGIVRHRANE